MFYIDLSGEWSSEKLNRLSQWFLNKSGPHEDIRLYLEVDNFQKIAEEFGALRNYGTNSGWNTYQFLTSGGYIFITYSNKKDHCILKENNIDIKYIITNKLDEYKESFDDLLK